jgi:prephenate dehydrogenase
MKVGIIGFGRLGKLAATNLAKDCDLLVFDPIAQKEEVQKLGATFATLEQVCQCKIILPIVPISQLESVLKTMAPLLTSKDQLVIDVCSVKVKPCHWMQDLLPAHTSILGTHPMFGPDSAKKSLYGHKIVLCPTRIEKDQLEKIQGYLESHGLKVVTTTADDHDQQVASSLLLTHFIGRSLIDFGASDLTIDTKGYRRLMKILETVENDTWQLFVDMNDYNPYAKELRKKMISSMTSIDQKLSL